ATLLLPHHLAHVLNINNYHQPSAIGSIAESAIFFYQAEDGIRGGHVTGVQTCALPISGSSLPRSALMTSLRAMFLFTPARQRLRRSSCRKDRSAPCRPSPRLPSAQAC